LAAPGPTVDASLLAALAAACRGHEGVRFGYQGHTRRVEPYRLAHTGRRWYLVAFDLERDDWRTFRVDRIEGEPQPGPRFTPRPGPAEDFESYVADRLTTAPYRRQAAVLFHAPLERMAERTAPTAGRLEARDAESCIFHAGAATLDEIAVYVALKGVEFEVLDPPELADRLREIGGRLLRAAGRGTPDAEPAGDPGGHGPGDPGDPGSSSDSGRSSGHGGPGGPGSGE
jgi:predicted DNA-binding transcriptional regulator YafY